MTYSSNRLTSFALATCFTLSACGGGGGSSSAVLKPSASVTERYALVTSLTNDTLSSYAVDARSGTMRLTDKEPSISDAAAVVLRPDQNEVLALSNNAVYQYSLDNRGQLAFKSLLPIGNDMRDLVLHPSGQSLYIADFNDMGIYQLTFDEDGELAAMEPDNFVGPDYLGAGFVDLSIRRDGSQLYAADLSQDRISRFDVAPDGTLTYVDSIAAGNGPWRLAQHHASRTLYAINRLDGTLSMYRVHTDGSLESLGLADDGLGNVFEVGQLEGITLDNSGRFLYVSDRTYDKVWQFAVTGDGTLASLPGYAIDVAGEVSPGNLVASPASDRIYLADVNAGAMLAFDINDDGTLLPTAPSQIAVDGRPTDMVFTTGKALTAHNTAAYVTNAGDDDISQFRMDDNGILATLGDSNPLTGNNPVAIAVHPTHKYLYVANADDNTVSQFRRVASTLGEVEVDELTPIRPAISADLGPADLAVHPSGNFLYVLSRQNQNVTVYNLHANGEIEDNNGIGAYTPDDPNIVDTEQTGVLTPSALTIDPSGRFLWVVNDHEPASIVPFAINTMDGSLTKLDAKPTVANARAIAISTDGQALYTAGNGIEKFLVDDDGTLTSEDTVPGIGVIHLLMSPTDTLYAVNEVQQSISWFSQDAGFDGLAADNIPGGLALAPNGQHLLLALKGSAMMTRFSVAGDGSLVASESVAVGSLPTDVAIVGYTE